jgi:uncharacterized protein YjiS (DUF1127 family)
LALWREFRRWRRNQDDIAALQALDARMLKDIGISRSEITSVVTGRERDASRRRSPALDDLPKLVPTPRG